MKFLGTATVDFAIALLVLAMISIGLILVGGACWTALSIWKAVFAFFM